MHGHGNAAAGVPLAMVPYLGTVVGGRRGVRQRGDTDFGSGGEGGTLGFKRERGG